MERSLAPRTLCPTQDPGLPLSMFPWHSELIAMAWCAGVGGGNRDRCVKRGLGANRTGYYQHSLPLLLASSSPRGLISLSLLCVSFTSCSDFPLPVFSKPF